MSVFEQIFGVPAEHSLLRVKPGLGVTAGDGPGPWEHEEYDEDGWLVAVYESRLRDDGGLEFVKYSPHGWVLSVSGRSPRLPPKKARTRRTAVRP
jgi:hypothetical protein